MTGTPDPNAPVRIIEMFWPLQPQRRQEHFTHIYCIADYWQHKQYCPNSAAFVCFVDGTPVLRKQWHRPLPRQCTLAIVVLPAGGGGGKNPLNTISSLLLMGIAPYLGSVYGSSLGAILGTSQALGTSLVTAGVQLAGSLLIGSLFPPERKRRQAFGQSQTASPTYSLQGRGNVSRLGSPIPVVYGRHRIFPDLAARPWLSYEDNEQYLHQLHVIGQGYYNIEETRIDDTNVLFYRDITTQIITPGQSITLFDPDQVICPEVSGQELEYQSLTGPFALNPPSTRTRQVHIDVICPNGLYYANDDGTFSNRTATFRIEAVQINDVGQYTGHWFTIGHEAITANTNTPIRRTFSYNVPNGRYMIRMYRTNTIDISARNSHRIYWQAARATLNRDMQHGDLTLLAVRMRASNNLNSHNRGLINCIVQRRLPTWSTDGGWTTPLATRSIAWAIADIARSEYGGKLTDNQIDLHALEQLDQLWSSRQDYFDAVFDQPITVWEALNRASRCGRAGCFLQAGILRTTRDQAQSIPVALFTPRNIVADSLHIDYRLQDEDTATSVELEYHNKVNWTQARVYAEVENNSKGAKTTIALFGCTETAQAEREAAYIIRANRYRRKMIRFRTELEGLIPTYGDLIAISHPMPHWGSGGEVLEIDKEAGTLHLSEDTGTMSDDDEYYLGLRNNQGGLLRQFRVIATTGENVVQVTNSSDLDGLTPNPHQPLIYAFGRGDEGWRQLARVVAIRPQATNNVEITAIAEDNRVHQET